MRIVWGRYPLYYLAAAVLGTLPIAAQPSASDALGAMPSPTAPAHINSLQEPAHFYRYMIGLPIGDAEYRAELSAEPIPSGPYYNVAKDSKGRILRVTGMRAGHVTGTTVYEYAGDSKLPYQSDDYDLSGNLVEITPMQRDGEGRIIRWEHRKPDGKLAGYTTGEWSKNHLSQHSFDANGKPGGHSEFFYGAKGTMMGRAQYAGPGSDAEYSVQTVDEVTQFVTAARQYRNGKLLFTTKYFWEPDGSISRKETYTEAGFLGILETFDEGDLTDRVYQYPSGHSRELRYFYDQTRQRLKTEISVDGELVCTLVYAYNTPSEVTTTAYGADGTLWAKYPPPGVLDLNHNGQPEGRSDGVLFRKGDWW